MGILVITVDLGCCRCKTKITKVLDCLKGEFCIEKVEFEDKENRVIVRGKFDAEKLSMKIRCKACKVVKDIKIVEVWPPVKDDKKEKEKVKEETPKPKPEIKLVPYPYPLPYPYQWPCHCCKTPTPAPAPTPPPAPTPSPPPPKPTTTTCKCKCTCSHHDCGHDGCRPPQPPCVCDGRPPMYWPSWQPHPGVVLCQQEDNACSIM